jgi:hypothetical protein
MKKIFLIICIGALLPACGSSDEATPVAEDQVQEATDQALAEANEMVDQILRGEGMDSAEEGTEGCAFFESGVISELFNIDALKVSYRRSIPVKSVGHVVCLAAWEKPDKAELEVVYQEAIMDWTKSLTRGEKKPRPEYPKTDNDASVTLVADKFDSAQEAVASLDLAIETMSKGVTFNVGGKQRTTQIDFEPPMEGIGDKAVFTEKGTLHVAYDAKRISVALSVSADPAVKRQQTIQLAQRLISGK